MASIELRNVRRVYLPKGAPAVDALRGVDVRIDQGEFVAIVGPSGGGKSTLLNIIGLLDTPTDGDYLLGGEPVLFTDHAALTAHRAAEFGFVFQAFHLLDRRSVLDNVELGLMYRGVPLAARREIAQTALESANIADRTPEITRTLSGGQRQRVAIARAIASSAPVILADEPTGNLDKENARQVMDALQDLHRRGATVVVVTHSLAVADLADRRITVSEGIVVSEPKRERADRPAGGAPRPSSTRMTMIDVFRDSWASIVSRPVQTIGLVLAVALGVAMALTTLGLSSSSRSQVSAAFDAQLNRDVTASWDSSSEGAPRPDDVESVISEIAGVQAVMTIIDLPPTAIATFAERRTSQPHVTWGDVERAGGIVIDYAAGRAPGRLAPDEILLGRAVADQLRLGPLEAGPVVYLGSEPYRVVGLIEDSRRLPLLLGEALLSPDAVGNRGVAEQEVSALVLTQAGAAQQVAGQAPIAVNPFRPDQVRVSAPTDPTKLRGEIEQGVEATLLVFTALVILIAIAVLSNATALSINTRQSELGLRKALGARNRDIAALLSAEAAYVGALGGIAGCFTGVMTILAITISQRWAPVFDVRLTPVAIAIGLATGILGSVLATYRATRIEPAESLRS